MEQEYHIYKAGGIILRDRKLLVSREKDHDFFVAPGGTLDKGETVIDSLIRELEEEFTLRVNENNFKEFGVFYAEAAGEEGRVLRMDAMMVDDWEGEPRASGDIEEILWIDSNIPEGIKVGSIFEHEVIPKLKEMDLID